MRVLLLFLVACGSGKPAKPEIEASRAISVLTDYGDRCLACNADKECVRPLRDEYDKYKRSLFKSREAYTPAEQTSFDTQFQRFALCGDGAGLTIWKN